MITIHRLRLLVTSSFVFLPLTTFANQECDFNYNLNLHVGYSKGDFTLKDEESSTSFNTTHNNATRIGGGLTYQCGETTVKYNYFTALNHDDNRIDRFKIINALTISNDQYGSVSIGKLTTPYKAAGKNGDPFWDTASGTTPAGNNFGFSDMTRGFTENSFIYTSPKMGNFYLKVGYSGTNSEGDIHEGIEYKASNSVFGFQYIDMGKNSSMPFSSGRNEAFRLYSRHSFRNWSLSGSVENMRKEGGIKEDYLNISVQRNIEKFGRIAASYGRIEDVQLRLIDGSSHTGDGHGITAGAFYTWTKNSEIYLLGSDLSFSDKKEQKSIVLGFTFNFSL
ncbi:porin [Marinibactrum halimedae]|uniref:Porin domain-containing protein n=1 Tax=Marinibactrum halimedae TaxID=1444977 RepID=A0AA37TAC3_9GAMM|nr:porin [Marinibactrum halimedae]MCD9460150.1 porin [Marinibactrum halimedae]GLS26380.1 hypothetical protein GCM10007877_20950 [Marinibactrum halimedae]